MYYYFTIIYYDFISFRNFPKITSDIALIIIALLMILISVNTFKPFVSNKTALISSICVFAFKMVTYLTTTLLLAYSVVGDRVLIIIILGSILINLATFWASYFSLKPTDSLINNSAEKA
jgi:hypothetical protein